MSKKNKLFSWLGFGKDDNAADNAVQQPESSEVTDTALPVQHSAEADTATPTEPDTQATPVTQTDAVTQTNTAPSAATTPVESAAIINTDAAKKPGFFSRLKQGLAKTSQNLGSGLAGLFSGRKIDD